MSKNRDELDSLKGRGKRLFTVKPKEKVSASPSLSGVPNIKSPQLHETDEPIPTVNKGSPLLLPPGIPLSHVVPNTAALHEKVVNTPLPLDNDHPSPSSCEAPLHPVAAESPLSFDIGCSTSPSKRKCGKTKKRTVTVIKRSIPRTQSFDPEKDDVGNKRKPTDDDIEMEDVVTDVKKSKMEAYGDHECSWQVAEVGDDQPREQQ